MKLGLALKCVESDRTCILACANASMMSEGGDSLSTGLEARHAHPVHAVDFYDGDACRLTRGVCAYIAEGLRAGEGVILIATPAHRSAFLEELSESGLQPEAAVRDGRLVLADPDELLQRFMDGGQPHWQRFQAAVEPLIAAMQARVGPNRIRAYGEMVDVLWNAGQSPAAARLERFWNKLMAAREFSLYCAYQIDVFGKEFHASVLDPVLCVHTHLLGKGAALEGAVDRGMAEVLGARAGDMKQLMRDNFRPAWAAIPSGEAKVLWIRNNLPGYADEILARARGYYEQPEARI